MEKSPLTLFLDFDGVLNNDNFLRYQKNHIQQSDHKLFDPANITALNDLCVELPIERIVISSSWKKNRSLNEIRSLISVEGFLFPERISAVTTDLGLHYEARADEIKEWISKNNPAAILILDDFDLKAALGKGFFRVNSAEGLTGDLVASIVSQLG